MSVALPSPNNATALHGFRDVDFKKMAYAITLTISQVVSIQLESEIQLGHLCLHFLPYVRP